MTHDQNVELINTAVQAAHFMHKYWLACDAAVESLSGGPGYVSKLNSRNLEWYAEQSRQLSGKVVELTELAGDLEF